MSLIIGQLEARLAEAQRRLAVLDDAQVEVEWVASCLAGFTAIWDALANNLDQPTKDLLQAYHLVAERRSDPGPRPNLFKRTTAFVREQF